MFKTLWKNFSKRRQKQFYLLLALMFVSSLSEIISLGAVLPFLAVLTAPEQIFQHPIMQPFILFLELKDSSQLILPLTAIFIASILLAGTIRLTLLYVMTKLTYAAGADISIDIYRRTLYQDYSVHVGRNSSDVINSITRKSAAVTGGAIMPILTIISSIILIASIMSVLFVINFTIAFSIFSGFAILYWIVIHYNKQRLKENSKYIADESTFMLKSLQEGLGGIRDVLIDGSQEFYCSLYRNSDISLRRASAENKFIAASPRYVMETIGMTLIAIFAYIIIQQKAVAVDTVIPILGTIALGSQRLLPALQQTYSAYSSIKNSNYSFKDIIRLLEQKLPYYSDHPLPVPIPFKQSIVLKNISFRHKLDTPWILKNLNLTLDKGMRIGIIGATGSGKSTLLDIIMGLLSPTCGEIIIDNQTIDDKNLRSWQIHIAHVPQSIYLSDSTIEENIAFGCTKEQIDHQQVKKAAKNAQILELIEGWKDGYQTYVGERGVRLSGGQRQRIGIARALYKKSNVLIFDEATSALDNKTEHTVMQSIEALDRELTIVIVAHRITTLKNCDQIVKLDKNNIVSTVSYEEIINETI
jgi:ATP-binding cassette subfamily B protein